MSLFYNKNECSVAYVKISEIFENDKLIVPAYQRKYAWGKEQINQFLDSISELVELIREASVNKVEIILGQIILLLNNDGDFWDYRWSTTFDNYITSCDIFNSFFGGI
jgi:uncharacterized protein with ParB-like and HNH nuclease domain